MAQITALVSGTLAVSVAARHAAADEACARIAIADGSRLATGKTNKAIAFELALSEKTIERHVSNIFDKPGVDTRTAAAAFGFQHGLL